MVCTLLDYSDFNYDSDFNYAITICVAERGTETIKGNESPFGHMWFELDDGKGGFLAMDGVQ